NKKKLMSFRLMWGTLFFLLLILILTIDLIPSETKLEPGDVSPRDINVPRSTTFINREKTEELRQQAADSAGRVYEEDSAVRKNVINRIEGTYRIIGEEIEATSENNLTVDEQAQEIIEKIQEEYEVNLEPALFITLLETEVQEEELEEMEQKTVEIMDRHQEEKIFPRDLENIQEEMEEEVSGLELPEEQKEVIAVILELFTEPNMFLDEEATTERRQEARDQVQPYQQTVREGEIIVRQGDIVTEDHIRIMEALGLQQEEHNYYNIFGLLLLVSVLVFVLGYYFRKYREKIWNNNKQLLFLELMVIIILLVARVIDVFEVSYLYYLVPVGAASILITVLISSEIAVIMTVFISLLVGAYFDYTFTIVLTGFCSGMVGIFSVSRISQRSDLVKAGFNISAVMLVMVSAFSLVEPGGEWMDLFNPVLMGVLNGLLVAILANGLLPYLENIFDLTSSVKLLELSNASHPLLKRMLVEAPGTYHHSVIVGNLAETAADNIGANSLLTRVAAYYHDIGKLKRPYFFTDNQFGGENPHDDISANLSSLIIKSHVKDGVELAHKYNLPQKVIDIIEQHHGKNLISYFYQEAREENKIHGEIEETDFSYEGPKPQSKEAAILMLADIVEAAFRSKQFDKSDHNRIESLVQDLVRDSLNKGHLDESNLTLKELNIIGDSFVRVLTGIYHQRIEYPDNLLEESKKDDIDDQSED
ncbi:MAG: HD family phosphohydrolase, partial [bacterium]